MGGAVREKRKMGTEKVLWHSRPGGGGAGGGRGGARGSREARDLWVLAKPGSESQLQCGEVLPPRSVFETQLK